MLPILRILPVGGVVFAIMILVLALAPPDGSHHALPPGGMPARGALMQMGEHPEWRQFLILAATRRANELSRLRDLPDTPVRTEAVQEDSKDTGKVAGLPADRGSADPNDATGTITEMPGVIIPIEIGETSATELPMRPPEEKPPAVKTPERVKAPNKNRTMGVNRTRRTKPLAPGKPEPAAQFNLLETLFGGQQARRPATGGAQPDVSAIRN